MQRSGSLVPKLSWVHNNREWINQLSCCIVAAYKHADGKKIDGRRVLVDVERARTVKGWRPRRLGMYFTSLAGVICYTCLMTDSLLRWQQLLSQTYNDDLEVLWMNAMLYDAGGGLGSTRKSREDDNKEDGAGPTERRDRSRSRDRRRRSKSPVRRRSRSRERRRSREKDAGTLLMYLTVIVITRITVCV